MIQRSKDAGVSTHSGRKIDGFRLRCGRELVDQGARDLARDEHPLPRATVGSEENRRPPGTHRADRADAGGAGCLDQLTARSATELLSPNPNPAGAFVLGYTRLESPVRGLGIGVDDAAEIAECTEVSPTGGLPPRPIPPATCRNFRRSPCPAFERSLTANCRHWDRPPSRATATSSDAERGHYAVETSGGRARPGADAPTQGRKGRSLAGSGRPFQPPSLSDDDPASEMGSTASPARRSPPAARTTGTSTASMTPE